MSYCEAMEAAGAEVIAFQEFGSYQGEWWAFVKYEGETGWVNGSYGSCSGCDAFEGEFSGYGSATEQCDEHRYEYPKPEGCENCVLAAADYQKRLADFGRQYVFAGLMTQEEALKESLEYGYDSNEEYSKTLEGEQTAFVREKGTAL